MCYNNFYFQKIKRKYHFFYLGATFKISILDNIVINYKKMPRKPILDINYYLNNLLTIFQVINNDIPSKNKLIQTNIPIKRAKSFHQETINIPANINNKIEFNNQIHHQFLNQLRLASIRFINQSIKK